MDITKGLLAVLLLVNVVLTTAQTNHATLYRGPPVGTPGHAVIAVPAHKDEKGPFLLSVIGGLLGSAIANDYDFSSVVAPVVGAVGGGLLGKLLAVIRLLPTILVARFPLFGSLFNAEQDSLYNNMVQALYQPQVSQYNNKELNKYQPYVIHHNDKVQDSYQSQQLHHNNKVQKIYQPQVIHHNSKVQDFHQPQALLDNRRVQENHLPRYKQLPPRDQPEEKVAQTAERRSDTQHRLQVPIKLPNIYFTSGVGHPYRPIRPSPGYINVGIYPRPRPTHTMHHSRRR